MTSPSPLEAIFFAALEKGSPAERASYLDEACHDDSALRQQIERMLTAQAKAGSFLEVPAGEIDRNIDLPISEMPGAVIGCYRLLEQIGDGGMGVVYMAQQREPVRRKVALKIIKPGMDTREVIARFEAERQALALMDHPNIAQVLEAGVTDSGRPYFVMELVNGVPLTDYCDQNRLTARERLELFVQVCRAVEHAHQKGIIHRDIKPSNVMVTLYDGVPVPKIIDFGVAKSLFGQLTEKTFFTHHGQMLGTPLYMSP
ncbi:MAG: serine/threonine-protein kinase, partial [Thermoguttaceae bacterium]